MEGLLQRLDGAAERHRGLRTEFQRMLGASRAISHRNRELLFELHALQERLRLAPPARFREALSCVEIAEGHANLTERLAMLKLAQAMVRAYEDLGLLELGRAHSGWGARGPASRQARRRHDRQRTVKPADTIP